MERTEMFISTTCMFSVYLLCFGSSVCVCTSLCRQARLCLSMIVGWECVWVSMARAEVPMYRHAVYLPFAVSSWSFSLSKWFMLKTRL